MKLLIFGMGYTAQAMLDAWPADWPRDVVVTTRSPEKARGACGQRADGADLSRR
jgi:pyrroline-5-carboxylate reductase